MPAKRNKLGQFEEGFTTHGATVDGQRPHIYIVWKNMKARCRNSNRPDYKYYGGRGIDVCSEWEDFGNFRKWAINNGYKKNLELDRIENDGDYCPENCRWVTHRENIKNSRNCRIITYDGKAQPLIDWAEEIGINAGTIRSRLDKLNWSVEEALTTPIGGS